MCECHAVGVRGALSILHNLQHLNATVLQLGLQQVDAGRHSYVYENTVKVLCISLAVLRMSAKYHHEDGDR